MQPGTENPVERNAIMRALARLAETGTEARARPGGFQLVRRTGGISTSGGLLSRTEAEVLLARGWAAERCGGTLALTTAGRTAARHAGARIEPADGKTGGATVRKDGGESPLAWLARRRNAAGDPLLPAASFAAGERLRADFTRAGLSPRMSADWSGVPRSGTGGMPAPEADATLAARQRLRSALDAAGSDFAGLLLDVCCFLKPLDAVEKERGWPARSAKVVLGLGLARLAAHYGLDRAAKGAVARGIRVWRSDQA
jgi:hypothetical protein